jgi:hypothetical protein
MTAKKTAEQNVERVWESVKLDKNVVDLVRAHKDKTFVPISVFIEQAIREKLKKSRK